MGNNIILFGGADKREFLESLLCTGNLGDLEHVELAQAMYRLDDEERVILSLSVLSGYTGDEIAKICGIKSSTVRSKLMRTKEKLRSYITA